MNPITSDANRRVVVTGLGAVSPLGLSVRQNWEALIQGRSGIGVGSRGGEKDFERAPFARKALRCGDGLECQRSFGAGAAEVAVLFRGAGGDRSRGPRKVPAQ